MSSPASPPAAPLKPGMILDLTLEKFADRGKSLARVGGMVVFVAGGVPGDRVRARVFQRKRQHAEARLEALLEPSPLRTDARCRYFGVCGGCAWQHVDYPAQLDAKRQSVADAFAHTGGFRDVVVRPTLGADPTYGYRNKMEFSFGASRWLTDAEIQSGQALDRHFALGLHIPGRFDRILDIEECHLQSDWSSRLVNRLRDLAKAEGWTPYDTRAQEGFLRHLVLRTPANTPERMVNLVTNGSDPDRMARVADLLHAEFPETTTFVNTIHTGLAQTAFGERTDVIFGPGVVHEVLGGYRFEIAPNAFFQTNTRQAETLYAVAAAMADLRPEDLVYDLYCGAGSIALYLSGRVRHVVGVELVPEAVANARVNMALNGVTNCTFRTGDMRDLFTDQFVAEHGRPDVLIVDPPRAGLHPLVVEQIGRLRPARFVYVSCNPQTQARDLALLREVYDVADVQPVDLFPHTQHTEAVARCVLRAT